MRITCLLLVLLFLGCGGKSPKELLRERGRPEPYRCISSAPIMTCVDAAGVVWLCDGSISDSECIATSQTVPAELR